VEGPSFVGSGSRLGRKGKVITTAMVLGRFGVGVLVFGRSRRLIVGVEVECAEIFKRVIKGIVCVDICRLRS